MLTEVDWGAHDSSVFLYLEQTDHDGKPTSQVFSFTWRATELLHLRTLLQGKFPPHDYGEADPKEKCSNLNSLSIIGLLPLKAVQRSFKTLFPCSMISDDENNFGICVTTSHQDIVFLEKRDG